MQVVKGFSKAGVTFQFRFWSITGRLEKEDKQDAESRSHK